VEHNTETEEIKAGEISQEAMLVGEGGTAKGAKRQTPYCNEKTNRSEEMHNVLDDLFDLPFNLPDRFR
jgi:hypothetical protein